MPTDRPSGVTLLAYRLLVAFDEDLHVAAVARSTKEAAILRDYLESNGVAVTVRGEHQEYFLKHYGVRDVELQLLVSKWQLSWAEQLLAPA